MKVKTMTSNALLTNSKTVPEYVESINEHLTNATESWLRVAREFTDAKTALSKSDFKELLKQTRFTSSTISKLIKIATSERVKKYEPKLALIDAWSTMHEITKLGRYVTFQLAEVAVPRSLFQKVLALVDDLRRRPAPA